MDLASAPQAPSVHRSAARAQLRRLSDALEPGARVWVSSLTAEPLLLQEELLQDPQRASGVTFMGVQYPGIDAIDYLALHSNARQVGFFMTPALRRGLAERRAELLPLDYLAIARLLQDAAPPDLAIAHLAPPDAHGWCSAGLASDFMPLVWARARRRVAQLNPRMPRTKGSFRVHLSELDGFVEAERPLTEYHERAIGDAEAQIARHVASLVRDGDTLQFGVGSIPAAVGPALTAHRRLRLHSGMLTGALQKLWEAGALDRDARHVGGVVVGDAALHAFAGKLDSLWLTDVRETHDPAILGARPGFVAVNGAVEVDLFGQVNSERANGLIQAGAGGLPAFAQGAWRSPGGRLIICLPSSARQGTIARIVPCLSASAVCTIPRYLADTVVTEHGIAELKGLSMDRRAEALIGIAAPQHRDSLAQEWDGLRRSL